MIEADLFLYLVAICILILLSGFFSASETAFISFGKHHFQKIAEKNDKIAKRLSFWFENPNRILVTALVGNNIVNITASVLAATLSYKYFQKRISTALITGVMTLLVLVFGEIIPKSLAKKHSETVAYFFSPPIRFFCIILTPIVKILLIISRFLVGIFGGTLDSIIPVLTEDDLKAMIVAGEEEGIIEEEERNMIDSIFELGDKMVKEIMTPRMKMVTLDEEAPISVVVDTIAREGFSRMPVYRENMDKITGIVYIKDIVARGLTGNKYPSEVKVKDFMREPYFVPESKKVGDLIRELQEKKMQMAIVVDEYGGTAGLVTMEDLVEEIVGEISDEYKKDIKEAYVMPDGCFLISGSMEIEKANQEIGLDIPLSGFETVAGFVLERFGRFPQKGESFVYGNHQFTVQESDSKKVRLIKIKKLVGKEGSTDE